MLAAFWFEQGALVDLAALSAVALIGFGFGRRSRRKKAVCDVNLLIELGRAQSIAKELEHVGQRLRTETCAHLRNIASFHKQLQLMHSGAGASWQKLRDQADSLLGPTMKLTTTLSLACDQLRAQQSQLTTYAGTRTDPGTGLHNRRSMMEHLEALLSAHADGDKRLALAVFRIPADDEGSYEDQLKAVGRLLEHSIRANDVVARYSEEELVVLMPKTPLAGALVFSERFARLIDAELDCAIWGGVVEAGPSESPERLLSRADSALYSARTHDSACLFLHNGHNVRRHVFELRPREGECGAENGQLVQALA